MVTIGGIIIIKKTLWWNWQAVGEALCQESDKWAESSPGGRDGKHKLLIQNHRRFLFKILIYTEKLFFGLQGKSHGGPYRQPTDILYEGGALTSNLPFSHFVCLISCHSPPTFCNSSLHLSGARSSGDSASNKQKFWRHPPHPKGKSTFLFSTSLHPGSSL